VTHRGLARKVHEADGDVELHGTRHRLLIEVEPPIGKC
jgi:hypothetical protein